MKSLSSNDVGPGGEAWGWRAVQATGLLPGLFYLGMLALGLVGQLGPARWTAERLLAGAWGVPMLLLLVIGGPTVSVLASLILGLDDRRSRSRFREVWGTAGWVVLLLSLITLLPFPWLFAVLAD
ncbi:MAG: hypothetical protein H7A45_10680 [Verrucomicrobiales bacterium]|nr:hypothetical protein [Verrucomicrobiales bacterium]MCP5526794.1 hypothetical protein [Verrucomicrobiales bacterium]